MQSDARAPDMHVNSLAGQAGKDFHHLGQGVTHVRFASDVRHIALLQTTQADRKPHAFRRRAEYTAS